MELISTNLNSFGGYDLTVRETEENVMEMPAWYQLVKSGDFLSPGETSPGAEEVAV